MPSILDSSHARVAACSVKHRTRSQTSSNSSLYHSFPPWACTLKFPGMRLKVEQLLIHFRGWCSVRTGDVLFSFPILFSCAKSAYLGLIMRSSWGCLNSQLNQEMHARFLFFPLLACVDSCLGLVPLMKTRCMSLVV